MVDKEQDNFLKHEFLHPTFFAQPL